ncbi:MAG: BTAD domain-containing putative transcriptional regulator [Dehalococcoidia bacterium]|nr:BTAD domain-containing putative transcriptional regulator [Dehalococcoidia bacterium]
MVYCRGPYIPYIDFVYTVHILIGASILYQAMLSPYSRVLNAESDLLRASVAGPSRVAPPSYSHALRRRKALFDKLNEGLGRRLVVVRAAAGYGKTAFLAEFAHDQTPPRQVGVAWLSLDRCHLDRVHLLRDLALAVQSVKPDSCAMTLEAMETSKDVLRRWDYFMALFTQDVIDAGPEPIVVVLDQYESIAPSPSARDLVAHLVKDLPSNFTLLVSTRPLLDTRLVPATLSPDDAWEISAEDLSFSAQEVRELASQLQVMISREAAEELVSVTGGSPAAIHASLVWATRSGDSNALTRLAPCLDLRQLVCEEILLQEPAEVQDCLASTALVEYLNPELACALAGDGENEGLRALIRVLNGGYPGLITETQEGALYHHNPIFRQFLLKRFQALASPDRVRRLHLELAECFSRSQRWDSALHHLLEASEYQRASHLVAELADRLISDNRLETVARWIDAFPADQRSLQPWLQLYRGVIFRLSRDWDKALALYISAADAFREMGDRNGLARALWYASQVMAYRRNQQQATLLGSEALAYLDPSEKRSRAWILHTMGNSCFDLGNTREALSHHQESLRLSVEVDDTRGQMTQGQALGLALHRLGRLKEAQQSYLQALELQAGNGDINVLCWVRAGLSHLRSLQGDYSESLSELREIAGIARRHHLRPAEAFALSCLASVYLDFGDHNEAEACCLQALEACDEFDDDTPQIDIRLKLMEIQLRKGESGSSHRGTTGLSVSDWITASNLELTRIAHNLLEATIFLKESRLDDAEQRAIEARTLSTKIGATYHEAQACYLLALAYLRRGDSGSSARLVEDLLSAVEGEGYASFLLRDTAATTELLVNAGRCSRSTDRITSLMLKLAMLKENFLAPLSGNNGLLAENRIPEIAGLLKADALRAEIAPPEGAVTSRPERLSPVVQAPGEEVELRRPALEIRLLGDFKVVVRGRLITDRAWRTQKAKELFAYLLTRTDRRATRDELLEILWPELGLESAVSNFHFTVHSVRHALEPHLPPRSSSNYLVLSGRTYRLSLPADAWIDTDDFQEIAPDGLSQGRSKDARNEEARLGRAADLYRGDYLVDFDVAWADTTRQHLQKTYMDALGRLALLGYLRREYDRASYCARALIEKDNYREDAYRIIMRSACEIGAPARALKHYGELTDLLRNDLDIAPDSETQQLYLRIKSGTYQRTSGQVIP